MRTQQLRPEKVGAKEARGNDAERSKRKRTVSVKLKRKHGEVTIDSEIDSQGDGTKVEQNKSKKQKWLPPAQKLAQNGAVEAASKNVPHTELESLGEWSMDSTPAEVLNVGKSADHPSPISFPSLFSSLSLLSTTRPRPLNQVRMGCVVFARATRRMRYRMIQALRES
jgi:hypothetical protein